MHIDTDYCCYRFGVHVDYKINLIVFLILIWITGNNNNNTIFTDLMKNELKINTTTAVQYQAVFYLKIYHFGVLYYSEHNLSCIISNA